MFGIAGTAELSTFCPGTGTWNRLQDGIVCNVDGHILATPGRSATGLVVLWLLHSIQRLLDVHVIRIFGSHLALRCDKMQSGEAARFVAQPPQSVPSASVPTGCEPS